MIVALECGCEVVTRRVGTPDEIRLCVWHFMAQPCTFCGERIGKDGHLDRDDDPVCDGCWQPVDK